MTTGARGDRGSCDRGYTEVRLSLEDNRSNVDTEGSSRGFDLRLRQEIDWVVGELPGSSHVVVSGAVGGVKGAMNVRREL